MATKAAGYWWAGAVAALAALAAVVALALVRPWSEPALPAALAAPTSSPEPAPEAVLAAAGQDAPAPTAAGVRAAIDDLVRGGELGESVSAAVVDAVTGEQLYGFQPDRPTIPASTIKLVTGATVLATRGPAYQLATVAVAGAEPGEVVLVGGGDPTLAVGEDGSYPGAARLDRLADQVRDALGDTEPTRLVVDSTRFGGPVHGPWSEDIPGSGFVGPITALMTDGGRVDPTAAGSPRSAQRFEQPDLAAGRAFAQLLGLPERAVERGQAPPPVRREPRPSGSPSADPAPADPAQTDPALADPSRAGATPRDRAAAGPPPPGTELGRVTSPPVQRLVEIMLTSSDNVVAEALARQVALARGQPATFAGAGTAMTAVLAELGVSTSGAVLADGSGLSRQNRLPAALLTQLLGSAATGPERPHAGLFAALPVAGWSGTLADRYRSPQPPQTAPGAGSVRAKTGSLDRVDALAGVVTTADGRVLAFALLADAVPVDPTTSRTRLDRIAAALAGCGCR